MKVQQQLIAAILMNIKRIKYGSKNSFDDLVSAMLTIGNSKLLKDTETANHTATNPTGVPPLPIKFDPHLFSTITQLPINSFLHPWNHTTSPTKDHIFH